MVLLTATELSKVYGDVTALQDVSLEVGNGELFGFLGPNGAGKTTTISILTGQISPTTGSVELMGLSPVDEPVAVREQIGILPERESPPSHLTPRIYFNFVGDVRGIADDVLDERVDEWCDWLEFHDHLDTPHKHLSRGQQQKVMIIQSFLHEPEFVFIDEPLVNLDPIMQERVKESFVDYCEAGNTIFISTHHISVAEEICTRVGIINNGRLVADLDPKSLDEDETLLSYFDAETHNATN